MLTIKVRKHESKERTFVVEIETPEDITTEITTSPIQAVLAALKEGGIKGTRGRPKVLKPITPDIGSN